MKNRKGFTLVELLVAATIIGALAVFATVSYRNSSAEARWTAAKARADRLAGAVQQFRMDFHGVRLYNHVMSDVANMHGATCPISRNSIYNRHNEYDPQVLILCGYIENGGWTNNDWEYMVDGQPRGAMKDNPCSGKLACVQAKETAKVPSQYKQIWYYVNRNGVGIQDNVSSGGGYGY